MQRFKTLTYITAAIAVVGFSAELAHAHGGGGDLAVFMTADQADVGFAVLDDMDINREFFDPEEDVFLSILVPIAANPIIPFDVGSSEPGHDAHAGDLPGLAELSASVLQLWYWDGQGDVNFTVAAGVSSGYAPQPLVTGANGAFHSHPTFGLSDETDDGMSIPEGVYMAKLQMSVTGLTDSDPYYMVTLIDDEILSAADPATTAEELGELVRAFLDDPDGNPAPNLHNVDFTFYADAVAYARAIPEPSSITIAVLALVGFGSLGKRRARSHRLSN
jgi:hypothetical protein